MARAKSPIPEGLHSVTPHLILDHAAPAIEWYKKALGAEEFDRAVGADGKIMHARLKIGNSELYVNDAMAGGKGPKAIGGSPASFWLYVEDADTLFNRAVSAGGTVAPGPMGQMQDQFWGDRCGSIIDPAGYTWTIATRKEDLTPAEIQKRQDDFFKKMSQPAH
jgi:PhnB protein